MTDLPLQTVCRACGTKDIFDVANFGEQVPANSFRRPDAKDEEKRYPLLFRMCSRCWLGQLGHIVPKEELYAYYPYVTSTSRTMARHLENQCANILSRTKPLPKVVEIGSNTGLFLRLFKERHSEVFGFEPAQNLAESANAGGIPTVADFFNQASATQFTAEHGKADVIIARHVLAHIDCWRALVAALDTLCASKGLIILEVPHVVDVLEQFQFDTIYHEHLSCVSLKAVETLLEDSPFCVQDLERCSIHGGSMVLYIRRRKTTKPVTAMVEHIRILEDARQIGTEDVWAAWRYGVADLRDEIVDAINLIKEAGVAAYGASARGNMLLQYCELDSRKIRCVADNTPTKIGRLTPGTGIPVVSPDDFLTLNKTGVIRYALLLAWNFAKEIRENNVAYEGKWIIPIPQVRLE